MFCRARHRAGVLITGKKPVRTMFTDTLLSYRSRRESSLPFTDSRQIAINGRKLTYPMATKTQTRLALKFWTNDPEKSEHGKLGTVALGTCLRRVCAKRKMNFCSVGECCLYSITFRHVMEPLLCKLCFEIMFPGADL